MLPRHTLLALLAALQVYAVPLNINLGAYSPALVVGDGEISFGGAQNAGALMETLASGAAANAAGGGAAAGGAAAGGQRPEGQQQQGGQQQPAAQQPQAGEPAPGAPAAQAPAGEAAAVETNAADGDPARSIAQGLDGRAPNMAKRSQDDVLPAASLSLEDVESQILEEARKIKIKREINGFREALAYAREAQKTQPKVELGSEGAGVGIVVNAGVNVPANSAANGAGGAAAGGEKKAKREIPEAETEQKQGITLLAIAEI